MTTRENLSEREWAPTPGRLSPPMGRLHRRDRFGQGGGPLRRCLGLWWVAVAVSFWGALSGCTSCPSSADLRQARAGLTGGTLVFEDSFAEPTLSASWSTQSPTWRIEEGALRGENAHNAPIWLTMPLPEQVRVEFDATALSDEGDLKFEIFTDGQEHESGYIGIYGGWSNTLTVIARLDEHGEDRLVADSHLPVETGRTYRFAVIRTDHRVRWVIDGELRLSYDDDEPLEGDGHRFFGFNDWEAPVRFDNVAVYDLGE